jgi:endoglucanase
MAVSWRRLSKALLLAALMACSLDSRDTRADLSPGRLSISVQGDHLIDGNGKPVQLRGASISGLEGGSIFFGAGNAIWSSAGLGGRPDFERLTDWKLNAVRLPLNEDSWLGKTVTDIPGRVIAVDAGAYRTEVQASVAAANRAGLYVILDLHWAAPASFAANAQNPMMDADNSLEFWTSIANTFKGNPAVLFELYNEPYVVPASATHGAFASATGKVPDSVANAIIRDGGTADFYFARSTGAFNSAITRVAYRWHSLGYQPVIDAVRAAGASNVILCGGNHYSNDLTWWSQQPPEDPSQQLAVSLHLYPGGYPYNLKTDAAAVDAMLAAIVASHPLVITEMGDEGGSNPAVFANKVLAWADSHGYSVLAWSWNPWGGANTLIQDNTHFTPTAGLGRAYHDWAIAHK